MSRRVLHRFQFIGRLLRSRLRAQWYRLAGATIGAKSSLGARVRIDRPWNVKIGFRTTFETDVWLKVESETAKISIGDHSFVGRSCEIDCTELVSIGDHTLIAPGVFITDHNHNIAGGQRIGDQGCTRESVQIGEDVWIGTRAVILPGVMIGNGAVVAAGAVVTKNIGPNEIWAGVPAKSIGRRQ